MANGVAEATWLRQLLQELHTPLRRTLVIILVSSSNPVQHQRTRHIEIDIHFVRERVAVGDLFVSSMCHFITVHGHLHQGTSLRSSQSSGTV